MIIKSVELENIRSYAHEKIEFPVGSVLLKGDIGAGKSTILYAIEFALFGIVNDLSYDMLLRKGASYGKVKLHFIQNNNDIVISRTIKKYHNSYSQDISLIINGIEKRMTDKTLRTFVFKLLNYPFELINAKQLLIYRYTIYTPQEQMKQILFSNPQERLKIIHTIFGIDKYERVKENIKKLNRELRHKQEIYTVQLDRLNEYKEKHAKFTMEVAQMKTQILQLKSKLNNLKQEYEVKNQEYNKKRDVLKEYELKKALYFNTIEQIEKQKANLKKITEDFEQKVSEIKEIKNQIHGKISNINMISDFLINSKNSLNELLTKLKDFLENSSVSINESNFNNLSQHILLYEDVNASINGALNNINSLLSNLDKNLTESSNFSQSTNNVSSPFNTLFSNLKEIELKLRNLLEDQRSLYEYISAYRNKINTTLTQLNSKKSIIENKLMELNKIKDEVKMLQEEIERVNEEINNLKKNDFESLDDEIQLLEEEQNKVTISIGKLQGKINELKNTISKLETLETCPLCYQRITPEHKNKIIKEFNESIEELTQEIQENQKHYNVLKQKLENLHKMKNEVLRNKSVISEKEKVIAKYNKMLQQKTDSINQEKVLNEERESIIGRLNELEKLDLNSLHKIEQHFKDLVNSLNNHLFSFIEFENHINEITNAIYSLQMLQSQIISVENNLNSLNNKLNEIDFSQEKYEVIKKEVLESENILEKLSNEIMETSKTISALDSRIQQINLEINELTQKITELNKIKIKSENTIKLISFLKNDFVSFVENLEQHIRVNIYRELDEFYKLWFEKLIDDELISTRLDIDFSPIIEQNNYEIDYAHLSGGEKTACALAYRLALNKAISQFFNLKQSLIILDEPTDGFSYEQLDKIKDILHDLMFNQVIIVSHETKIESFVDHVIEIEKINGVSHIVK